MASRHSSTSVTETSLDFPLTNLADNVTYDVTITAIPTNGTVEDGQSTTLYFAKAAPQVGTVSAPAISISPTGEQDGVYYVDSDFTISWSAEGDVAGYHLYFTDGTTDYANGQVDYTEMSYSPEQLVDGVTYEVTVTAIPTNGTVADGQSTTLYFMKAAPQVGTVGVPQVSVSPVSYVDGDVQYLNSDATWAGMPTAMLRATTWPSAMAARTSLTGILRTRRIRSALAIWRRAPSTRSR